MATKTEITDDFIKSFLKKVENVPKPIEGIVRSGEGGEHLVWIIDDAFVLRVHADGQDNTLLVREKEIWDLLVSIDPESTAIPNRLEIGALAETTRLYGLYRKLSGASIEPSSQSSTAATEEDLAKLLVLLKYAPLEKMRILGIKDEEFVDFSDLREQARKAWQRLHDNGHIAKQKTKTFLEKLNAAANGTKKTTNLQKNIQQPVFAGRHRPNY